jgi:hypothetical protein
MEPMMKRHATDAEQLIETIWTDAEYRAMIEEQHWGLMRKRYQSKPEPLPTDATWIGEDGRCDDEDDTDDVGLPSDIAFRCAIGVVAGFVFLCAIWLGGK